MPVEAREPSKEHRSHTLENKCGPAPETRVRESIRAWIKATSALAGFRRGRDTAALAAGGRTDLVSAGG